MSTISDGATVITPQLVLGYETAQEGSTVVHHIIGRAAPDVTLREAGLRTGDLKLFFLTEAEADAARRFHTQAKVFTYAADDNTTTSMLYVLGPAGIRTSLDDGTRRRWIVTVAYQEVTA